MKLEHPEDLSFFYKCRTFLHKKILSGYVRVLDLCPILPLILNNVELKMELSMNFRIENWSLLLVRAPRRAPGGAARLSGSDHYKNNLM